MCGLDFEVRGGATVREASEAERRQWAAGMNNVAKVWAEKLEAEGAPGKAVLATYMNTMRAAGATPLRDWDKE